MKRLLLATLLVLVPLAMWATGVDILVLTNGDQIEMEAGPSHGFVRLPQEAAGGVASECNEAGETGQIIMDTTGAVNAKLEICTAAGWETVGNGSTGGDNTFVNGTATVDFDLIDSSFLAWTKGGGAPDTASGAVIADSVEGNQDLLDFEDSATADTCTATEAADGSYIRRDVTDSNFECVQHWKSYKVGYFASEVGTSSWNTAVTSNANLQQDLEGKEGYNNNLTNEVIPLPDTGPYMHAFHKFQTGVDVRLDYMICCLSSANALNANETVTVVPWFRRWGNGSGGDSNGAASLTMTVTNGTTIGRQDCNHVNYNILSPYPARTAMAVRLVSQTLTSPDDISVECHAMVEVAEF